MIINNNPSGSSGSTGTAPFLSVFGLLLVVVTATSDPRGQLELLEHERSACNEAPMYRFMSSAGADNDLLFQPTDASSWFVGPSTSIDGCQNTTCLETQVCTSVRSLSATNTTYHKFFEDVAVAMVLDHDEGSETYTHGCGILKEILWSPESGLTHKAFGNQRSCPAGGKAELNCTAVEPTDCLCQCTAGCNAGLPTMYELSKALWPQLGSSVSLFKTHVGVCLNAEGEPAFIPALAAAQFMIAELFIPFIFIISALLILKSVLYTSAQVPYTSKHQYTAEEDSSADVHSVQRWASVSGADAVMLANGTKPDLDIEACHRKMLGRRDELRDMDQALAEITDPQRGNDAADFSWMMFCGVVTSLFGAATNIMGIWTRALAAPVRDASQPSNLCEIFLVAAEFIGLHFALSLWLFTLARPSSLPEDSEVTSYCNRRWPTRSTLKVRLVHNFNGLLNVLGFNALGLVAQAKPLGQTVTHKLCSQMAKQCQKQSEEDVEEASGFDDDANPDGADREGSQGSQSSQGSLSRIVDVDGDGQLSCCEKIYGVVVLLPLGVLMTIFLAVGIILSAAFCVAVPVAVVYIKLGQISFVSTGHPYCPGVPLLGDVDPMPTGCWNLEQKLSFIAFVYNIASLSTALGSSDKGFSFMFRGADGKLDAEEEGVIRTAEKLVIQALMRRHGALKALAFWNNWKQDKVYQLFIQKNGELAGNLRMQFDGKGPFLEVRAKLDSLGKLKLQASSGLVTVDLAARDPPCSVGPPKSLRLGHPHCLRIDNQLSGSEQRHFIIDMGSAVVLERWKQLCLQHATESAETAQVAVARGAVDAGAKLLSNLNSAVDSIAARVDGQDDVENPTETLVPPASVAPRWIEGHQVKACMRCQQRFGAFKFKHHCRACGCIACGTCSQATAVLEQWFDESDHTLQSRRSDRPLRVCNMCHTNLQFGKAATLAAGTNPARP